MADGLHAGDSVGDVIEKTLVKNCDNVMECKAIDSVNELTGVEVNTFYPKRDSANLFVNLCSKNGSKQHEGLLAGCEEDCRKKRCVDRYDSSESSDSGVAVLSCTDCSGSSTASSDITDPGSPFSTASNHSEDSGAPHHHTPKMPPAQTAHYPPWPWTADERSPIKRPFNDKTVFSKRQKENDKTAKKQSPSCLSSSATKKIQNAKMITAVDSSPTNNNNNYKLSKRSEAVPKMQQGKITEYFKTQVKNGLRKDLMKMKSSGITANGKIAIINQLSNNTKNGWRANAAAKKVEFTKTRKLSTTTVPRKILPAPSKIQEPLPAASAIPNLHPFTQTMITAVSFPSNLTYLHAKAPKPPDNIFMQQFATIGNEKVGTIPILNRNPCLNVIHQPVQKIATINNFNCVKLNATVVPIVNLNALPPRLNASTNIANVTLSVDTAMPTVLPARPKMAETGSCFTTANSSLGKQFCNANPDATLIVDSLQQCRSETNRTEEPYRTEECQKRREEKPLKPPDEACWNEESQTRIPNQKSPSPADSDSGISSRGSLEISVDEQITEEPKKSPILSQPKTIRFPAVKLQKEKDEGRESGKSSPQSNDGRCRWNECAAQFNTSGALLEHLQVKHVISQSHANQEQYVCLWRGCKVHGRTSCSRSWLERHVLAHAGTKPFRCIVDGCGQRFNSQLMLERHVNNHFNGDGTQNANAKKSVENGPVKLFKRNGRIIRFRRQPWSARMFDFIDSGIMEGLQHKLLCMTQVRTLGQIRTAGEVINLQSQILARRTNSKGNKEVLVRWIPADVVPDEWIPEKEYKTTKALPIPSLSSQSREALSPALFPAGQRVEGRKHHRKPLRRTT